MAQKAILAPFTDRIRWCSVSWWEDYGGEERVQKRMKRIRRHLVALYELAYVRRLQFVVATMSEKEIEALARRPLREIKARLARLTAMVRECIARKPKPNGHIEEEWLWLQNPGEHESWYEVWSARDKVSDPDQTEAHLIRPRTLRNLLIAKLHSKWIRDRSDTRSWKSNRRVKWRVLADFSVSPT